MSGDSMAAALVLEGVHKQYGAVPAVCGLDLRLAAGEVLTLVGPSGCGKSTALRLAAGLERPDAGAVWGAGRQVAGDRRWRPVEQRNVGMCFQEHALFPHLTVAGNVAFGLQGSPAGRRRTRVRDVLEMMALGLLAERYPHELSGGEQQRVALARAVAPEPALVLLDEPFSNLDRNLRGQIRRETIEVLRRTGTSAVFVTHDPTEALASGDRVAVLRAGRVVQAGTPDQVFHYPVDRFVATFLGDADFLPAKLADGQLVTEVGAVPAPDDLAGEQAGEGDLAVMVRPHEVELRPAEQGIAQVREIEFQGGFVLHTVALPSGQTLRSLQPHTVVYPPGTRLHADLAHGHRVAVLAANETACAGQTRSRSPIDS